MRKNIFLHKTDLIVELHGYIKFNDIITLKKNIDSISSCYDVEKIIMDISKAYFKIDYLNAIKNKKTIFINKI